MQFLFVPPLLFGNRRCRLPSQTQGLGRVTVHEHWHFFSAAAADHRGRVEAGGGGAAAGPLPAGDRVVIILRLRRLLRLQLR